jgi:hypothetical protein
MTLVSSSGSSVHVAPQALAALRNLAIGLLHSTGETNLASATRRYNRNEPATRRLLGDCSSGATGGRTWCGRDGFGVAACVGAGSLPARPRRLRGDQIFAT